MDDHIMENTNRTRITIGIIFSAAILLANVALIMSGDMHDFYAQIQAQLAHWGLLPESIQVVENQNTLLAEMKR